MKRMFLCIALLAVLAPACKCKEEAKPAEKVKVLNDEGTAQEDVAVQHDEGGAAVGGEVEEK